MAAVLECIVPDAGDAVGYRDAGQSAAETERQASDVRNAVAMIPVASSKPELW